MGKATGFLEIDRREHSYSPVKERVRHFREFVRMPKKKELRDQGGRCMDCGIPYCHQACPVHNIIPDWNDLIYQDQWRAAIDVLHSTNNFPEMTGRICPAPCEAACTLNLIDQPVTIKDIERAIVDHARAKGWIVPQPPQSKSAYSVAVVGSGPAGLACAQQLARIGHSVTVLEKNDRLGGLLRYGIPDFKMEKELIDFRIQQMEAEGVVFRPNCHVGVDITTSSLLQDYDAIVLSGGAEYPRPLDQPGSDLSGVHFAMDYLVQQNRRSYGDTIESPINAKGQHVVVIGGGDTGSDCIGTANRQGAKSITQLEILGKPPEHEDKGLVWPFWPVKMRTSSSHMEGCHRDWSVSTRALIGNKGRVRELELVRVEWQRKSNGALTMTEVPKSTFRIPADLVLLAMGFLRPTHDALLKEVDIALDKRGNVAAESDNYQTSVEKIFVAGDMRRGQSLVVHAIWEGREAARCVDEFLGGKKPAR